MARGWLAAAVVAAGLAVGPAAADDAKKADPTAVLLAKLREPVTADATDATLAEVVEFLGKRFEVGVVVNEAAFRAGGVANPGEVVVKFPAQRGTLSLGRLLQAALAPHEATYLVRKGYVEVVPVAFAARQTRNEAGEDEGAVRLAEPLVSAIYKEKPLNEAVADIAEEFDLTVVVAPQAGDSRMAFVSTRLLNVPADKALELIAIQADLRVVRKGAAFLITSRDHANELFGERLEKERQKLEVEKLRRSLDLPGLFPQLGMPPPPPDKN